MRLVEERLDSLDSFTSEDFKRLQEEAETISSSTTAKPKHSLGRKGKGPKAIDSAQQLDLSAKVYGPDGSKKKALEQQYSCNPSHELPSLAILKPPALTNRLWSMLSSFVGQAALTGQVLEPFQQRLYEQLVERNVSSDLASTLCRSVVEGLEGEVPGTFGSVSRMVRDRTALLLRQILSLGSGEDLLGEIQTGSRSKRPFVIVFCGVNGVGKSTSLAKVAYWLLHNGLRILIAGCDTFRAGAVEQLRIHVDNLGIGQPEGQIKLFQRGYNRDASAVAKDAISHARSTGHQVVLIDTAGRMQDNGPLMTSLGRLVSETRPDRIIFVGEALVGNEAVDQLSKFNATLNRFQARIDGLLLSKFDCVDEKVGAALSMSYTAKAPVLFVGVGQTYGDLCKFDLDSIVTCLLD